MLPRVKRKATREALRIERMFSPIRDHKDRTTYPCNQTGVRAKKRP